MHRVEGDEPRPEAKRAARRQQREQFDWAGAQFTRAIGSYYHAAPGGIKAFPRSLEDLLEDRRSAVPRRHLRSVYLNPYTASADWELLKAADGGVRGVRGAANTSDGIVTQDFSYAPLLSD